MGTSSRFSLFFAATLLAGSGCDQASTPLIPTSPDTPTGKISVRSIRPDSGATLIADRCDGGYCIHDTQLALAFDVQLNQDVGEPWVTVSLYNGSQRCAGS